MLTWIFFVATFYLIVSEALSPWLYLPAPGSIGFTAVFVLFAVLHCLGCEGASRTAIFFISSAVISYVMEDVGVRTGLIYGAYHYSDKLGPKLGYVPVIIPLAWFMMIYPSWRVAAALLEGINARSLAGITALAAVAAVVMTGWDMVMDPGMAAGGNWIWEDGGSYFGVPTHNFLGWLLTTFPIYWLVAWIWRSVGSSQRADRAFRCLPVIIYAAFSVRYLMANHYFPALQLVALFSMALPGFVALIRVSFNGNGRASGHVG